MGDIQAGFTPAGGVAIKTEKKIGDDAVFNAGIEIRKDEKPRYEKGNFTVA